MNDEAIFLEGGASVNREGEAELRGDTIKILGATILVEGNAKVIYPAKQHQDQPTNGKTILYNIPARKGKVIER